MVTINKSPLRIRVFISIYSQLIILFLFILDLLTESKAFFQNALCFLKTLGKLILNFCEILLHGNLFLLFLSEEVEWVWPWNLFRGLIWLWGDGTFVRIGCIWCRNLSMVSTKTSLRHHQVRMLFGLNIPPLILSALNLLYIQKWLHLFDSFWFLKVKYHKLPLLLVHSYVTVIQLPIQRLIKLVYISISIHSVQKVSFWIVDARPLKLWSQITV